MAVKLAPAFDDVEFTRVWRKVVKHTEKALKEARLEEYDVVISSLPLGTKGSSNSRAKRTAEDLEEDGIDGHASLKGRQFEVQFSPDMAIKDAQVFAEVYIVGTLDEFVNPIDSSEDDPWDSDSEDE